MKYTDKLIVSYMSYFAKLITVASILMVWAAALHAQKDLAMFHTIAIQNPSMEGFPTENSPPYQWLDCGFPDETAADTQPGQWEVVLEAKDGMTYLGMVVRDNETYEAVTQQLSQPMKPGYCYDLTLYLARSESYWSPSRSNQQLKENFINPAVFRVWGGMSPCARNELLKTTGPIIHNKWKQYNLVLQPSQAYRYLILEVFYRTPFPFPYNGHVLVDNLSDLKGKLCELPADMYVADAEKTPDNNTVRDQEVNPTIITKDRPKKPTSEVVNNTSKPSEQTFQPVIVKELTSDNAKAGKVIPLDMVNFEVDSFSINQQSSASLNEVYSFLAENKNLVIEVGGHTNTLCQASFCNTLSTKRAKAVRDYLVNKGIEPSRVKYKGYGKSDPRFDPSDRRVAYKNQRVEIKVLSN